MTLQDFKDEAARLARSSIQLKTEGDGEPMGYLGEGPEGDMALAVKYDGTWFNLFKSEDGWSFEPTEAPPQFGTPLFGSSVLSLPPVDAIFKLGGPEIDKFLKENRWERDVPFNDNFSNTVPSLYNNFWMDQCPLYTGKVVAVMGGWHFAWPDDDWYDLVDSELALWTFEGAEPWIEVFRQDGDFQIFERVT